MKTDKAIGVFDSGLGGLTVLKHLVKMMPEENFVYFGDTARVPYGSRPDETIIKYARQDCAFLMEKGVKMIVIACGTVSAVAGEILAAECGVPVYEIVKAGAKKAALMTKTGKIGVIGTAATIRNHSHKKALLKINPDFEVIEQPCPLFVPLVENGFQDKDNPVTRAAIEYSLGIFKENPPDVLILGCTHYPLLSGAVAQYLPQIGLIDPGEPLAVSVRSLLEKSNALNMRGGEVSCFASDRTNDFEKFARAAMDGTELTCGEAGNIESYKL